MLNNTEKLEDEMILLPGQYRRLWLDSVHECGLIAEMLAEVLGWQPSSEQMLPDALELASVAAGRIVELEAQLALADARYITRDPTRQGRVFALN